MDVENLYPPDFVRAIDQHLTVEPASAEQCRIENLRPVGGGQQDQSAGGIEAVHLDQQLVERLLLLIVPAGQRPGATGATEGVQFINEDDRRCLGTGLLEQVTHPRGTHPDKHLDKLGAGNGEERHLCLAGHGPRQQRLAGAGRANQQHALGHASAEAAVGLRITQELDNFLEFVLGLVDAGHISEANLHVSLDVDPRFALADLHHAAAKATAHAAQQKQPDAKEQRRRNDPRQQVAHQCAFHPAGVAHRILLQVLGQLRLDAVTDEASLPAGQRLLEGAFDTSLGDRQLVDAPILEVLLELAVGDRRHFLLCRQQVLNAEKRQDGDKPVTHVKLSLFFHPSLLVLTTMCNILQIRRLWPFPWLHAGPRSVTGQAVSPQNVSETAADAKPNTQYGGEGKGQQQRVQQSAGW